MSKNDALFDLTVRRSIFIERLSTKQARDLERFLNEVRLDLEERIRYYKGTNLRTATIIERQMKRIDELIADVYLRLNKEIRKGQRALSASEAKWNAEKLITLGYENVQSVTGPQVYAAMRARPAQGLFVKDMVSDLPRNAKRRLQQALRISYTEGEAQSTAISRVRQITKQNWRGAEMLVRTANSHIATVAEMEHTKANHRLYDRYQWSSILDRRTTPVCQHRDGMIYPLGPGGEHQGPVPPAHPRCRSAIYSLLKGEGDPERVTYNQWLTRQKAPVQNEILGPARGKLFRAGKFNVNTFVDQKGQLIPIKELTP